MKKSSYLYSAIETGLGETGVVFRLCRKKPLVCRIILPDSQRSVSEEIRKAYPGVVLDSPGGGEICTRIAAFLSGNDVSFALSQLDLGIVRGFTRLVLQAAFAIPRGFVITYSGLAARIGRPHSARAVGNALAANPFPLVIPCHRVVKRDGALGGFGGGTRLKRSLLELEHIAFDARQRVLPAHILA
jgi:methylated-DNA-[protein]-cysteine S-methyltransferase